MIDRDDLIALVMMLALAVVIAVDLLCLTASSYQKPAARMPHMVEWTDGHGKHLSLPVTYFDGDKP